MKKVAVYGGVGITVLLVLVYLLFGSGSEAEPQNGGQVQRVAAVVRGNLELSVSADGVIQPINRVEIKSKASGQVEKLNFEEGQYVERGELLLELDQRTAKNDYEQAKADLELQEANVAQAENNYRRAVELFGKQLISEQERDQANVDHVRAKSQLIKARAALSSADERLVDTRIVAPVSGIILTKTVETGQIISSGVSNVGGGTLIATIADMNVVHVETNVDEVDIGRVQVGQRATVTADAHPDDSFRGEVIRISPLGRTQQNVTTFNVIVRVPNVSGKLKAGMSASVELEVLRKPDVLMVPNEALKDPKSADGQAMLALSGDSTLLARANAPDTTARLEGGAGSGSWRERMQSMSEEERQKFRDQMRARFQNMSPEERQRAASAAAQRSGGGGVAGPGPAGGGMMMVFGGPPEAAQRQRKQAQIAVDDRPKTKVVMVRRNGEFVPELVKTGPSNFDFTEVIEGLQEGDEVQINQISRARLASQEFTERLRSRTPIGSGAGIRR